MTYASDKGTYISISTLPEKPGLHYICKGPRGYCCIPMPEDYTKEELEKILKSVAEHRGFKPV